MGNHYSEFHKMLYYCVHKHMESNSTLVQTDMMAMDWSRGQLNYRFIGLKRPEPALGQGGKEPKTSKN